MTAQDYEAAGQQLAVHQSGARIRVLEWGRDCGKSRCAVWELIRVYHDLVYLERPSTLVPKIHIWVLAPSYPQARQAWEELNAFIPLALVAGRSDTEKTLRLHGDCFIEVKSADNPSSLQTVGLDFLWITEADNVPDEAWYNISPALARSGRLGKVLAEGRPVRAHSWFETLGRLGRDPAEKEVSFFHWTSPESPYCDKEKMELDKRLMPERRWRMEYLAERAEGERAAFSNVKGCIKGEFEEPQKGYAYVIGFDVGRTTNPSVLIVMDTNRRRVVAHQSQPRQSLVIQKEAVIALSRKWGNAPVVMDSTGIGYGLYDELRFTDGIAVRGVQFGASAKDRNNPYLNMKEKMYTNLMVALERESISYPNIPQLITQLEAIEVTKGALHEQFEPPAGYNDDYVAALALALYGCHNAPGRGSQREVPIGYF